MEDIKRERKSGTAHARRRAVKPAVVVRSRRTGLVSEHSHTSLSSTSSTHRKSKSSGSLSAEVDEEDPMASFLPFCAYCENQILIPNSTVLFCSARCHRLDSEKSLPAMPPMSPTGSSSRSQYFAPSTPPSEFFLPQKNYIPPLLPTPPPHQSQFNAHSAFGHATPPPTPPPSPSTLHYERKHYRNLSSNAAPIAFAPSSYTRPLPPLHRPGSYSSRDLGLVAPQTLSDEAFVQSTTYGRYGSPRSGIGSMLERDVSRLSLRA